MALTQKNKGPTLKPSSLMFDKMSHAKILLPWLTEPRFGTADILKHVAPPLERKSKMATVWIRSISLPVASLIFPVGSLTKPCASHQDSWWQSNFPCLPWPTALQDCGRRQSDFTLPLQEAQGEVYKDVFDWSFVLHPCNLQHNNTLLTPTSSNRRFFVLTKFLSSIYGRNFSSL